MTARPTAGKIPDLRVIPTGIRLAFLFPIIGGVTLHYTQSPDLRRAPSTSAFSFLSFSSDSAQQHEVNRAQKHPGIVNSEAAVTHSPFLWKDSKEWYCIGGVPQPQEGGYARRPRRLESRR
ncbi:hypothetical protein BDV33DRAFT_57330 [Aspergillus novoparasiticus]|uniref:Uncharacterized protein n=1 Tax=Aspergillus novoparasiticus TaxID=986946 RepID=A0A5N6E887_9EURO|nr:hypothetical protein BDV33DRAFT_57330 [Aspergillus novoparasiticus]